MWSKLLTCVLTVLFVVAVGNPVVSHDGKSPATLDPTQDEQPWGGEHNYDPPNPPLEAYPDPGKIPGSTYFIAVTVDFVWLNLGQVVIELFEVNTDSGKTGQTHTLDQTSGETNNQNQGTGTR